MKTAKRLSWLMILAGLWLLVSPFVLGYVTIEGAMRNAIMVGILLVVIEAGAISSDLPVMDKALDWLSAFLGLWLIAAPMVLGFAAFLVPTWNAIIVGGVVIVLSLAAEYTLSKPSAPQL
ncbi:MAG: SPW repeat protein [Anaerolineae bacterium]|nr:SPW repeat protein [Anaerolineae bacterium]